MTDRPSIAELRRLESEMTCAGSQWRRDVGVYGDPDGTEDSAFARGPMVKRGPGETWSGTWMRKAEADSDGIAALRNAAPVLLEIAAAALVVEATEYGTLPWAEARDRLRAALGKVRQ